MPAALATVALAACGGGDDGGGGPSRAIPPEVGLPGAEAADVLPARTTAVLSVGLKAPADVRTRALELAARLGPALNAAGGDDDDGGDPVLSGLLARRAEVARWSGGQLAFALGPGGGQGTAYVLTSNDRRAAERTIRGILPKARRSTGANGAVRLDTEDSHVLVLRGAVVLGDRSAVGAVQRQAASGRPGLGDAAAYRRAMTRLPSGLAAVLLRPAGREQAAGLPAGRVDLRLVDGGVRASVRPLGPDGRVRPVTALPGEIATAPSRGTLLQATTSNPAQVVGGVVSALGGAGTAAAGGPDAARKLAALFSRAEVRVTGDRSGLLTRLTLTAADPATVGQLVTYARRLAARERAPGGGTITVRRDGGAVLVELRTRYDGARAPGLPADNALDAVRSVAGGPVQALVLPSAAAPVIGPLLGGGRAARELARAFSGVGVATSGGAVQIALAYDGPAPSGGGGGNPLDGLGLASFGGEPSGRALGR